MQHHASFARSRNGLGARPRPHAALLRSRVAQPRPVLCQAGRYEGEGASAPAPAVAPHAAAQTLFRCLELMALRQHDCLVDFLAHETLVRLEPLLG